MPRLFSRPAGRRLDRGGYLEYVGETGYYWSSSTGPYGYCTRKYREISLVSGDCRLESRAPAYFADIGYSIRCVKDEMSSN